MWQSYRYRIPLRGNEMAELERQARQVVVARSPRDAARHLLQTEALQGGDTISIDDGQCITRWRVTAARRLRQLATYTYKEGQ